MDKVKSYPCDCCSRSTFPGDGKGLLKDFDILYNNFSYPGIPICGECGGLGVKFDSEDFKERVARILKLRFEFHPIDNLPEPPTSIPYVKLKALLKEVEELNVIYGLGIENSYAMYFIAPHSPFREVLPMMEESIAVETKSINEYDPDVPDEAVESVREALIKLYSGEIDEGLRLFKIVLEKFPNDSRICHDLGTISIIFKRDVETALEFFQKSTTLEPKKALHFYQTAKALVLLEKYPEAIEYFRLSMLQPDFKQFLAENKDLSVGEVIDLLT